MDIKLDLNMTFIINGDSVSYPNAIKQILKYKKWSIKDMAKALGLSHRTVSGWRYWRKPCNSALVHLISII